jgi:predicted MPP superfamily phosphohydrolase
MRINKWGKYDDEIIKLFSLDISNSEIARRIAKNFNIPYHNGLRKRVGVVRHKFEQGEEITYRDSHSSKSRNTDSTRWEESQDSAVWNYQGEKSITTLDQAIKYSKVNLKYWEVDRWVFNSWDVTSKTGKATNYQVKVFFKKKDVELEETLSQFYVKVEKHLERTPAIEITTSRKKKHIGVVPLADFHIGAYIRDLIRTQNFDVATVVAMLDDVALEINKQQYSEVHVAIIGDLIESFTGLNHPNSWKSMGYGQFGFNVMILSYEILENFLAKIINLKAVYGVSGNHDRSTSSNKEDQEGDVLKGVMYFLKKFMNNSIEVEYHPLVINKIIDNISYVFTHGHQRFASKIIEKIILDYGKQGMFNIVIQGHWHKRGNKKPVITNVETIYCDSAEYRGVICPSLFTGNFYSEALGFTSTAGFLQIWNRLDKPAMLDLPLG